MQALSESGAVAGRFARSTSDIQRAYDAAPGPPSKGSVAQDGFATAPPAQPLNHATSGSSKHACLVRVALLLSERKGFCAAWSSLWLLETVSPSVQTYKLHVGDLQICPLRLRAESPQLHSHPVPRPRNQPTSLMTSWLVLRLSSGNEIMY